MKPSTEIAFSASVKRVQSERGSRTAYARVEKAGGFATEVDDEPFVALRELGRIQ